MSAKADPIDHYLKIKDVVAITSLSSATIYRYISARTFPAGRVLGPNCVRWRESEIRQWLDARPSALAS